HPYPSGNLWRAQKGASTIHIMGTMHLSDARLALYLKPLWPIVDTADLILLEADRETMEQLKSEMLRDPSLMFITDGPTLPERLSDEDWTRLTEEMSARGIPAFLVSKMQPWYASMMLAIPPCAMAGMAEENGVDHRIMDRAAQQNIPTAALESYNVVFSLFGGENSDDDLDMLRMSLISAHDADAMFVTMIEAYLSGEHRAIWELGRHQMMRTPGMPQEDAAKMYNELGTALLTDRNANWMDVILPAATEADNILVAVGAAHLSGKIGVLYLLEQQGYTLSRVQGF
ncbi:MAG: TraB/GumN family protein, partial [Marinosulfonomonas sp.]|nr:TraB/GumN family protein [Marinosulfonomonas sp.]